MTTTTTQTKTATKVMTHAKLAVAVMFLGFASLAASAAGAQVQALSESRLPDLEIRRIVLNSSDPLFLSKDIDGNTLMWEPNAAKDRITVFYRNVGETETTNGFAIKMNFNPAPYVEGVVEQLLPAFNASGTASGLAFQEVEKFDVGTYIFRVDGKVDSQLHADTNVFNLGKNGNGRIEILVPKYYRQMILNGILTITAVVDYEEQVEEYVESNNDFSEYILYSEIKEKTGNACNAHADENGNNTVLENCYAEGYLYACVDRYTQNFKGCVHNSEECALLPGDVPACKTGRDFVERPILDTVKFSVVGDTYSIDYSKAEEGLGIEEKFNIRDEYRPETVLVTAVVDNVSENSQYGFHVSPVEIDLQNDIKSIENAIHWKDRPLHEFRTNLTSYYVYVFVRNNDGAGIYRDVLGIDVDDATYAGFTVGE